MLILLYVLVILNFILEIPFPSGLLVIDTWVSFDEKY